MKKNALNTFKNFAIMTIVLLDTKFFTITITTNYLTLVKILIY